MGQRGRRRLRRLARDRYACFGHFDRDTQLYAYEAAFGGAEPCEQAAVEVLIELRRAAAERAMRDGPVAETLEALMAHLERTGGPTRAAVWLPTTRTWATPAPPVRRGRRAQRRSARPRAPRGRGAAVRVHHLRRHGDRGVGEGGAAERKRVRRALAGSWEERFHEAGTPALLLDPAGLADRRLQRAIGVIYRPETERQSHYFEARLSSQSDAVVHLDRTTALEPLERTSLWEEGELPETHPFVV